jgi:hypothetical protein
MQRIVQFQVNEVNRPRGSQDWQIGFRSREKRLIRD